ncbi:penicillin-binding protein 2 [Alloacidobacterium dinghuense]|uniref:Penicillin-binding protein 2 n=1 Tax=Alloacidobacterium dinghuense TaxID=2763107 RepID=A0A7G8BIW8_9BACT|nr:penicillin-binding protein 2 [Alloacidobacterium dinghuense]QNI32488.1 penicillin-binding protein 2 [Alloacidobacterium dinghuense]
MHNREEKLPGIKLTVIQYVIVGILLILIFGLWRLQVVGAENYHALAEANRIRKVPILAPRGKLFDREGRLVVDNYPSVSCFLVREQGHDYMADLPIIARGLNMTVDQIDAILKKYRTAPKYQPLPLKQDITPDEEEFIEAHRDEFPELETVEEQRRLYPKDGFAAHLIGYVGEVSEDMLNNPQYAYYEPGDVVGKSGVEQSYDSLLRGQDGSQDVIVDSHGREVGKLGTEHAVPGKSLKLTIDIDVQRAAENALGDRNGAIIAMDPHTGEVLAMVSRPTFDPNDFAVRIGREEWNKLITDPEHPLLNKAIQAQLAPGSTFKIIMSFAGLEEGVAQDMKVHCSGGVSLFGTYQKCWVHSGHGEVDIHKAIYQSCDVFFYTLAARLGIEKIAKWAHAVGIGEKTGIDLPNEVSGVMPSAEWKMKYFHQRWYPGEVTSVGIGQGAVTATPVQMARALSGIASGGVMKRPHVVFPDELPEDYRKAMYDSFPGSGDKAIQIDPDSWETITDAMALVLSPAGTDPSAHLEGIDFAGKTGSAQTMSNALAARLGHAHSVKDNAWFVGFTPRRNPDIVVCILFEAGEHGKLAGRLAARVIEAYVNKQRRLENNLIAKAPQKVDVGALWDNPTAPKIFGGKQVVKPQGDQAEMWGGHFYLTVPPVVASAKAP